MSAGHVNMNRMLMADCAPSAALQTVDFKLAAKASAGSACQATAG